MKKKRFRPFRFLVNLVKVILICLVLYAGYSMATDFKNFIDHPLKTLFNDPIKKISDVFDFKSETKIDTEVLKQKLIGKSKYVFAEEDMRLRYKFYRKKGKAWIKATFEWNTKTDLGIENKKDLNIEQKGNDLIVNVLKVRVFDTNNSDPDIKDKKISKILGVETWGNNSTPYDAFVKDRSHVAFEKLKPIIEQEKPKIINYAKESLHDFISSILEQSSSELNVIVNVNDNFDYYQPKGKPSVYYSDQKKDLIENKLNKKG